MHPANAAAVEEPDDSPSQQQHKKRRKAARACNHCQTAHLTCDDNRPCGRCVKRGLGDTCQDGARKKAKYLRDIEDALVNAGKAVPTHFIHSPHDEESFNLKEDTTLRTVNENQSRVSADPSPTHHSIPLDNGRKAGGASTSQYPHQQRHPTESPAQFTNMNLSPVAPALKSDASPSIEVPLADEAGNNNVNSHSHLPPNAYANTPSNLLNFDTSAPSSQLQPYNFFEDLNLGGGNSHSGGSGLLNDFSGFGMTNSNSANLEYAVLSSMLQNSDFGNTSPMGFQDTLTGHSTNNTHPASYQSIFTGSEDYGQMSYGFPPAAFENSNNNISNNTDSNHGGSNSLINVSDVNDSPAGINSYLAAGNNNDNGQNAMPSLQAPTNSFGALPIDHNWPTIASRLPGGDNDNNQQQQHQQHQQQQQQHAGHSSQHAPSYPQAVHPSTQSNSKPMVSSTGVMKVEDVYKHINKPYNYLEAYHALIRYLQSHFENKQSVLRIIRSLAIYRPSIIALHMPLTVDDEIFVERSFQRTLIELEKLISFSGTPTLVWRRTGEIVLVGTEFTLLSEWRREDLLSRDKITSAENNTNTATIGTATTAEDSGPKNKKLLKGKKRYIFEIFDQDSLVEYYESFAQHAFESSSATIMFTCSIVTPKGHKVPCTFGYNLKRDIFGLPQMIIGQFLPILTTADDPTE